MTYVDWNGEPLPQEHQSPEKFEMDAEFYPKRVAELEQQLAECQAREKVLRDALEEIAKPDRRGSYSWFREYAEKALAILSDSTALDAMLKQAKSEALLEAADWFEEIEADLDTGRDALAAQQLRRMAKELET